MDEQDSAHDRTRPSLNTLMGNANARMSHIQVDLNDEPALNGISEPKRGGGLAAKAGVILVSSQIIDFDRTRVETYAARRFYRVFIIFSSSCRKW